MFLKGKWYPEYFIEENYSIFFAKRAVILNDSSYQISKYEFDGQANDIYIKDDKIACNWDTIIRSILKELSGSSNDTSIQVIKHDYMLANPRVEKNYSRNIFFNMNPSPLNTIYEDKMQLCDTGMLVWGDSLNWGYYYGEELYHNFNLEEFDLFIIRDEISATFERLLSKYCGKKITLKKRITSDLFKVVNERPDPIFEITYYTH